MIKMLTAPIRSIIRFPLFQLAVVVGLIVWMQAAEDKSALGQLFNALDKLVEATVKLFAMVFAVKSFTKSWLTSGFMIAYVYLACDCSGNKGGASFPQQLNGMHRFLFEFIEHPYTST